MKRKLTITTDPIDEAALVRERTTSTEAGAALYFSGIVRGSEETGTITAIDYEANEAMARHQFDKIFDQVETRWPIESIRLIHRISLVKVNEASLWVEIISGHRGEAFEACQWLINEMKRIVPIWKHPQEPEA